MNILYITILLFSIHYIRALKCDCSTDSSPSYTSPDCNCKSNSQFQTVQQLQQATLPTDPDSKLYLALSNHRGGIAQCDDNSEGECGIYNADKHLREESRYHRGQLKIIKDLIYTNANKLREQTNYVSKTEANLATYIKAINYIKVNMEALKAKLRDLYKSRAEHHNALLQIRLKKRLQVLQNDYEHVNNLMTSVSDDKLLVLKRQQDALDTLNHKLTSRLEALQNTKTDNNNFVVLDNVGNIINSQYLEKGDPTDDEDLGANAVTLS